MVKVHENGKIYKVQLRAIFSYIRSERDFRNLIETGITGWEKINSEYAMALRKKSLFEVCSILGITTNKQEVK